ncbi:type II toxin-antitoxin system RelE/ParE family toxin [Skermanella sp. TT6]|uniref:Type II toxin-antitoxin system RelE/ParE family toxin n=1 Tax=Skermanella cutis TaxID=2775420 RepID=A0ABX7BD84_9PROT|nr:type II toxin-antitoxin system RelE/ParE family toxin [Skermanella sp. TT6]
MAGGGAYIAKDSPRMAEQFVSGVRETFKTLAKSPLLGRERDDLGREIRMFPFGKYLIFYRSRDDGVLIVRVLHGARSLPDLFKS